MDIFFKFIDILLARYDDPNFSERIFPQIFYDGLQIQHAVDIIRDKLPHFISQENQMIVSRLLVHIFFYAFCEGIHTDFIAFFAVVDPAASALFAHVGDFNKGFYNHIFVVINLLAGIFPGQIRLLLEDLLKRRVLAILIKDFLHLRNPRDAGGIAQLFIEDFVEDFDDRKFAIAVIIL